MGRPSRPLARGQQAVGVDEPLERGEEGEPTRRGRMARVVRRVEPVGADPAAERALRPAEAAVPVGPPRRGHPSASSGSSAPQSPGS